MEKVSFIETELQKFNIADAAINQMSKEYMTLTVAGLDDKEGYIAVKEARLTVKGKRVEVEKKRKELKEDSLRFGRAIDAEAKRITSMLEPIEEYLTQQQDVIDGEKLRIKQEAERIAKEKLQHRINTLIGYKQGFDASRLEAMSDQDFDDMAERSRVQFESEQVLLQEAEKFRQAEAERISKVAAEQQAERDRLAELDRVQRIEAERIRVEQQAIEREKERIEEAKLNAERERLHRIEVEQAQKIAAENARVELERRLKREAEEKAEIERLAAIVAERKLQMMPDQEKLRVYGEKIKVLSSEMPDIEFVPLSYVRVEVLRILAEAISCITEATYDSNRVISNNVNEAEAEAEDWSKLD